VIFRRVLLALMAAAMFAAAAGVVVVAAAFALYALAEPYAGRAGAAATVALVVAALAVFGGMAMALMSRGGRPRRAITPSSGLLEHAMVFVKDRPIVTASAAIAAGLLATRNPRYLGEAVRAFLEGESRWR
jgi:hypothetical protein